MTPRTLIFSPAANSALRRRSQVLRRERGRAFSDAWGEEFVGWLRKIAQNGAVMGTSVPNEPTLRSFPYKKHATVLAEFTDSDLRIIRVYFAGQDWLD